MGTTVCEDALTLVGFGVGGGTGEPVQFEEWLPLVGMLLTIVKFAQVMRVALAKCSVREPFPKKALEPAKVEA
jgi:hypothetical protein